MKHVILGGGEVGKAYAEILGNTYTLDVMPERCGPGPAPKKAEALHVAIRYTPDFEYHVREAIKRFSPKYVHVLSTVPPGTTERFEPLCPSAHSTTRGLHPHLVQHILNTPKHIGGKARREVAELFRSHSEFMPTILHDHAKTTELIHLASNFQYAVNIMAADEIEGWCRAYGVDYFDFMRYSQTHNEGYVRIGQPSKVRPVVWPSGGKLGGHCIKLATELIPRELHGPLSRRLSEYA